MPSQRVRLHRNVGKIFLAAMMLLSLLPSIGQRSGTAGASEASPVLSAATSSVRGYWMLGLRGEVYAFGAAVDYGDAVGRTGKAAALVAGPGGLGYWILTAAGSVWEYGSVVDLPSAIKTSRSADFVAGSATPSGGGLWAFTDEGHVVALGDATHYGDMTGIALNGPIIDAAITPDGRGYWLLGSDGGIFAFGNAQFHGSIQGLVNEIVSPGFPANDWLAEPIVGLVPSPNNDGYWLVAADGGVFAFPGSLPFRGSVPGVLGPGASLAKPINGMVAYGDGYLMSASDGGVFTFSNLSFLGSLGATPPTNPIVGLTPVPGLPAATITQTLIDGDGSSPLLAQIEFAPNDAGMTSMDVFGTRSGKTLTPGVYVANGEGPGFPLEVSIGSDGELDWLKASDGTLLRVVKLAGEQMQVEKTAPNGEVSHHTIEAGAAPPPAAGGLLGTTLGTRRPLAESAKLRTWTVYGDRPARIGLRLVTPDGAPLAAKLASAAAGCTAAAAEFECRITAGTDELLLHSGVRVGQLDGIRFGTEAECGQFEWSVGVVGGGLVPFALGLAGLAAAPATGVFLFVLGTASTVGATIETTSTDCAVVSADAVREAAMNAFADGSQTAETRVAVSFAGVTVKDDSKLLTWPMTRANTNNGGRIGDLTFVGQPELALDITSPRAGTRFTAVTGEKFGLDVDVVGGGFGTELVLVDFAATAPAGATKPPRGNTAGKTVRDTHDVRTDRFETTYVSPGTYTMEIQAHNNFDGFARAQFFDRATYTVIVSDPVPTPANCENISRLNVGEVCASGTTKPSGEYTIVFVEHERRGTPCFSETAGPTIGWETTHTGEFRYTTNVDSLRNSVTGLGEWRHRFHLTCLGWGYQDVKWDVQPIVANVSRSYAAAIVNAISDEVGPRAPACRPFGWPDCDMANQGNTGTMTKADAK